MTLSRSPLETRQANLRMVVWAAAIASSVGLLAAALPRIIAAQAEIQRSRAQEAEAHRSLYCGKFGKVPGTPEFARCLQDLQEFQTTVEKQLAEHELP